MPSKRTIDDDGGGTGTNNGSNNDKQMDGRGLKFGTDVVFGDVYYGGGEDGSEFVSSLPTDDEERKMFGDDDVRVKEQMETLDEGRVSHHPSTAAAAAAAKASGRQVR
jgi:hypothetical protein